MNFSALTADSFVNTPTPVLEAQITELAGHLNAGNHRFLVMVAEFDRRGGWAAWMMKSCAHWLNWKCGISLNAARERVRVARALGGLPQISAAMARGALSFSKVRALTRVATPATEELLLTLASHGTAEHLEVTVRCFRRAQEAEELSREAQQQAARRLSYWWDADGSLVFKGSLPAEAGALFLKAMNAAVEAADRAEHAPSTKAGSADVSAETSGTNRRGVSAVTEAHTGSADSGATPESWRRGVSAETSDRTASEECATPGERPSLSMRRADALARVAESFLAHGAEVLSSGDRCQLILHVDAQTLCEGGAGRCEHEDGPALPVETLRRLGCDASVVSILEGKEGETLNVGRKTRTIPPALRRALIARDQGCRFPGCANRHYVDGHHIKHWAHRGETRLSNLVLLCRFHHRQVHEGGVTVQVLNEGALRFTFKDGRSLDSLQPLRCAPSTFEAGLRPEDVLQSVQSAASAAQADWTQLFVAHKAMDIVIDSKTAVTRWTGEHMDYTTATEALLYRARGRKPPTSPL
jgi:hypothetical protein